MARFGVSFTEPGRRCWYWGAVETGRRIGPDEFRLPGRQGIGGAWFTSLAERARSFETEIGAHAALARLLEECGYDPGSLGIQSMPDLPRSSVIQDGRLRVPLYHGTSDLFLESIRRRGLGGANPLEPLRAMESLRDLVEWCDLRAESDSGFASWWSGRRIQMEPTRLQQSSVLNFSNGRTFLTPSRRSAARYALSNAYGSEALSEAILLYREAAAHSGSAVDDLPFATPPLLELLDRVTCPILFKAEGVEVSGLRSEKGADPVETLRRLDEVWSPSDPDLFEDLTQQESFELVVPIPADCLKIYRVVRAGDDLSLPEFSLQPMGEKAP